MTSYRLWELDWESIDAYKSILSFDIFSETRELELKIIYFFFQNNSSASWMDDSAKRGG